MKMFTTEIKNLLILFLFVGFTRNSYCHNIDNNKKLNNDSIIALDITSSNIVEREISNFSENQMMLFIDSLFALDRIPSAIIKEIHAYAENKLLKSDFDISITNYNENSAIPSNSTYEKWDTKNIAPYNDELTKNDTSIMLTLTDQKNNCDFVSPIQNPVVTSNFGWRKGKNHNGIDLDLEVWDPVVASFDGMVRIALFHPGYGRVVVIRHYNGLETLYAHLHRFKVKTGDIVEAGQPIGLGGSSGRSSGSHLHYEVRYKGKPLNPKHLISFKENRLISDSLQLIKQQSNYAALPLGVKYHTIKKGDFMYKIANRYGTTVNQLCEINSIRRNRVLRVGRKLRIK